jgi:hypothetical protein
MSLSRLIATKICSEVAQGLPKEMLILMASIKLV